MRCSSLVSILIVFLLGCGATKPLELDLRYKNYSRSVNDGIGQCSEKFYFSDLRNNKTLGQMSGQAVLADEQIFSWVQQAFKEEFGNQINMQELPKETSLDNGWVIELKKAYVMNQTTNMAATSVFRLRKDSEAYKQTFRGNVTHSNWNSNHAETIKVLNSALKDGLVKMKQAVISICQGKTLVSV